MKISINWIKDYVDLTGIDVHELAYKFTMSTAEIEEVYTMGADVKNVVAGKIVSCEEVENSKKLHKLQVDVGGKTVVRAHPQEVFLYEAESEKSLQDLDTPVN